MGIELFSLLFFREVFPIFFFFYYAIPFFFSLRKKEAKKRQNRGKDSFSLDSERKTSRIKAAMKETCSKTDRSMEYHSRALSEELSVAKPR